VHYLLDTNDVSEAPTILATRNTRDVAELPVQTANPWEETSQLVDNQ